MLSAFLSATLRENNIIVGVEPLFVPLTDNFSVMQIILKGCELFFICVAHLISLKYVCRSAVSAVMRSSGS